MEAFDCVFGDDDELAELTLNAAVFNALPAERNGALYEQRLAWEEYANFHVAQGTFDRRLRMSKASFDKLLALIRESLTVNDKQANLRGGSIIPELCLYCTLRWLAGGSYLDITDICGISKSSFYRVVWKTITAICKVEDLRPRFPQTKEEIEAAMKGFTSISYDGIINNCVGVVDGYLLRIKVPSKNEVGNVKSFFSGHYQCYGMNVQAVADHHSRFLFLALSGPGVMGDRQAIHETSLNQLIESLPIGACVIGDAAYCPTERMIPVYQGLAKLQSKYDNFNFFASQLRIRVEMAFGIMSMKWGILSHPLTCKVANLRWLVTAIGCLHNFCINERLLSEEAYDATKDPNIPSYLPSVPHDCNGDPIQLADLVQANDGHSHLREFMATRVERRGLERIRHNGSNNNNSRTRTTTLDSDEEEVMEVAEL
jgi:DDE superfamily endonuclease